MDNISINTIIGEGASFRGDLHVLGCLRIDGDVKGNIEATGKVFINDNARVQGDVYADSVSVGGVVQGDIVANGRVFLFASAVVLGDIISRGLQSGEDTFINGRCVSIGDEESYKEVLGQWKDIQIVQKASYR